MSRAVLCAEGATLICILAFVPGTAAGAEPCNPVIDGTYCASQAIRPPSSNMGSTGGLPTIENSFGSIGAGIGQPATLGAITFQSNGVRCIGLLRRGACN